jgi:OmpA-OmpF porin, OOP family
MRLRALLFAVAAFGMTGAGAWRLAGMATDHLEKREQDRVVEILSEAGESWITVEADGLEVVLTGLAPDEAARFRAVETVRRAVDPERIVDNTGVVSPDPLDPPSFALELLRNDKEISLIGLVPEHGDGDKATTESIKASLAGEGLSDGVTDMLETADYPEPEGWEDSLNYALDVLSHLPRAKISVEPGKVRIIAVADSAEAREALETRLQANPPATVFLDLDISAPRPVITPFRVAYLFDGKDGHFETCNAEDEVAAARIIKAAAEAGMVEPARCEVGLGAPSRDWSEAVAAGLDSVRNLGAGGFSITDTNAVLQGLEGTSPDRFEVIATALRAALPATYSLETVAPPQSDGTEEATSERAVAFRAELTEDGLLKLDGAVRDLTSKQAIQSYAAALFGHSMITDNTVVDESVPEGWPGKVIAGIDALHEIKAGQMQVMPDDLMLSGWGIFEGSQEKIKAMLKERVDHATVEVRFDAAAAAAAERALQLASMSRPEICAEEVTAILESQSIVFRPGSSEIDPVSRGVIAAIADVLRTCPAAQFEVAGHTDSQGEDAANLTLSRERAESVQAALEDQDLPLIIFRARGYGSDRPIADNTTKAGRLMNRRIELTLFEGAPDADLAQTESEEGQFMTAKECADQIADLLDQESIEFDVGASAISAESEAVISDLAETLRHCEETSFEVSGHTDSQGRADINKRISAERADAVKTALETAGLPETVTLSSRGYGADEPVADNSTREGRALNRRIEMKLLDASETDEGPVDASTGAQTAEAASGPR